MKYFCTDCNRTIKKRQVPWCGSCRLERYQLARKKKKEIPISGEPNPGSIVC